MKTLGFCILHTGSPYFAYALESIYDQVDQIVILFTPNPSQGFASSLPCPDSQEDLLDLAQPFMKKITWVHGDWPNEGAHTDAIWQYAEGFDWIWRFDADEIAPPGMVAEMVAQAETTQHKAYRVPFVHFWRCFHRVCRDGQQPVRLSRFNGGEGERNLDSKGEKWVVYHGGYAQPTRFIRYKMEVSGHRPEWRKDWFTERWLCNAQRDVHPVMFPTHWHAEAFDKAALPDVLKRHPYFNMGVIDE